MKRIWFLVVVSAIVLHSDITEAWQPRIDRFEGYYFFLSNFSPDTVFYNGWLYPTLEHAFQAAKCANPYDVYRIRMTNNPTEAKRIANSSPNIPGWHSKKEDIMYYLLQMKFNNSHLRWKLLTTRPNILIEGNSWHDNFWGNCVCGKRPACQHPGLNRLGRLLMKLRNNL